MESSSYLLAFEIFIYNIFVSLERKLETLPQNSKNIFPCKFPLKITLLLNQAKCNLNQSPLAIPGEHPQACCSQDEWNVFGNKTIRQCFFVVDFP